MTDKPVNNRPQINIRLDKEPTLLDEIKRTASDRNITVSEFLLDAIKTALGKTTATTPAPSLETILAELDNIVNSFRGRQRS
jgi:uncharacterized protein (DUF1778 family)